MHLRVEGALAGPPRPEHVGARIEARSNTLGVAGREDRLREDERDASAARVDELHRPGQGTRPPRPRTAHRCGRSRRPASSPMPSATGTAGCRSPRRTAARRSRARARRRGRCARRDSGPAPLRRRGRIDVDADEFARDARGVDTLLDGGEEASVTARRIEDPQRPARAPTGPVRTRASPRGRPPSTPDRRACTRRRAACGRSSRHAQAGPRHRGDASCWRVAADGPRRPWCARPHARLRSPGDRDPRVESSRPPVRDPDRSVPRLRA